MIIPVVHSKSRIRWAQKAASARRGFSNVWYADSATSWPRRVSLIHGAAKLLADNSRITIAIVDAGATIVASASHAARGDPSRANGHDLPPALDLPDRRAGSSDFEFRTWTIDDDLPIMNGRNCLRKIRSKRRSMPAVLMSGLAQESRGEQSEDGVVFVRKPFGMSELVSTIAELIKSPDRGSDGAASA